MEIYARQGDLVIEKIDKLEDEGLTEMRDLVFAGDSSGHRHRLLGVVKARRVGNAWRLRVEKESKLVHEKADGHTDVPMVPNAYEVRPLREMGDGSDRSVED